MEPNARTHSLPTLGRRRIAIGVTAALSSVAACTGAVSSAASSSPGPTASSPRLAGGSAFVRVNQVQSYSTVEPAIDLAASSPLAFSRQMAGRF